MTIANKIAFITGGASGMGLAVARHLIEQNAHVVIFDRDRLPGDLTSINTVMGLQGDTSRAGDVADALSAVRDRFGRLDLAINAAGITGELAPLVEQPDDGMDKLLAINVAGMFLAMKYEALLMRETGGAIVNFGSVYGRGAHANMVLYGASKHAVSGLTQGAAVEFAQFGIRVNAVAPGPIRTPFIGTITREIEAAIGRGIPQRRIGEPDEVAGAVLWLLSDAASYVTGATIAIDGGQAALLAG